MSQKNKRETEYRAITAYFYNFEVMFLTLKKIITLICHGRNHVWATTDAVFKSV